MNGEKQVIGVFQVFLVSADQPKKREEEQDDEEEYEDEDGGEQTPVRTEPHPTSRA
jgi:hypothetical protein